ncbi:MAG: hypothetical protein LBI19_04965 [Oscillospiraceae bacterium]|jgi:hypothetical protein|nr:hypothetical protein [Oscillospiraceae bacterium]
MKKKIPFMGLVLALVFTFSAVLITLALNINNTDEAALNDEFASGSTIEQEVSSRAATPEDIVRLYIELMKSGADATDLSLLQSGSVGDVPYKESPSMPLEEAESKGLTSKDRAIDWANILELQRRFVLECFGERAWDAVEFIIKEDIGIDFVSRWLDKETGTVMTEDECLGFIREAKLTDIDERFEVIVIPISRLLQVYFTFNGISVAESGEHDFKITLSDMGGQWHIYEGLSYNRPEPIYEGD